MGNEIQKDTFETQHGVALFLYDLESVAKAFGNFGLVSTSEIGEPVKPVAGQASQKYIQIVCKKEDKQP